MSLPFSITSRHLLVTVEGFTQASRVIAALSCREEELGMFTRELVPLNDKAPLNLPAVVHSVVPTIEPVLLLPEASVTLVPEPWSKE